MFSILDFLDSPDVRAYNKDTVFTPLEQAVIIQHSYLTSVEDKLKAWNELLDTYSEEEFRYTHYGIQDFGNRRTFGSSNRSNKEIVAYYVAQWEAALARRYAQDNVVYVTSFWEVGIEENSTPEIFTSFDKAVAYLQAEKDEWMSDEITSVAETRASIVRDCLDKTEYGCNDVFRFNNDMVMYYLYPANSPEEVEEKFTDMGMDEFFIYVPVPFRKGDLLRTIGPEKTYYGVLSYDFDEDYIPAGMRDGADSTDMLIRLEQYEKWSYEEVGEFTYDHHHAWRLEYCPESELPDSHRMLLLLKDSYLNTGALSFLLYVYTESLRMNNRMEDYLATRKARGAEKENP